MEPSIRLRKKLRRAIELTVSQVNAGAGAAKADVKFSHIAALYRTEHLAQLEHVTIQHNTYLLRDYIEPRFGNTYLKFAPDVNSDCMLYGWHFPFAALHGRPGLCVGSGVRHP